jgi:nitrite reductase (NO-forming)
MDVAALSTGPFIASAMAAAALLVEWALRRRTADGRHHRDGAGAPATAPKASRGSWIWRVAVGTVLLVSSGAAVLALASRSTAHATTHATVTATAPTMAGMTMAATPAATTTPAPNLAVATTAPAPHALVQAELPPVAAGDVFRTTITAEESSISIAPGVSYKAWTFNGTAPGPVIHVRQGQRVVITFRNNTTMPHSLDLHAARVRADVAFGDVAPGESRTISFVADDAGAWLYHCVTAPALMHIANGMYGALIVDPARPLPRAAHEFVLVASEWYLNGSGKDAPASIDWNKAMAMQPDIATFNGYANQYADHPLHVKPHQRLRFYVLNAGPNIVLPFHLVGGIFDRAYQDGDLTHWLTGVQTTDVPSGGAAAFDAHFDTPGVFGFVNHSFASVDKGEIGAIDVGDVHGTMTH